jgi:hypothetical protein
LVIENPLSVEAEKNFSITQFPNYQVKGLRYCPQGLRGSSLSVVWRGDWDLVALETWRAVAKSNDRYIKNWRTTWQTCNNSKNQS